MMKNILLCVVLFSLAACSEDMLTPQANNTPKETVQSLPDAKTLQKKPFSAVSGDWLDETNSMHIHIDDLGHFVMRETVADNVKEELGFLKNVSASVAVQDLRFELYRDNKQAMDMAFTVKLVENQRCLVLWSNGSALEFRYAQ